MMIVNPFVFGAGAGAVGKNPNEVGDCTGWWDFSSDANLSLSANDIISAEDLSTGGFDIDMTTGLSPERVTVSGKNYAEFVAGERLRAGTVNRAQYNPGTGDFSLAVVFRRTSTSTGNSAVFCAGKKLERYEIHVNAAAAGAGTVYVSVRWGSGGSALTLTDGTVDYDDGTPRVLIVTRSDDDLSVYTITAGSTLAQVATGGGLTGIDIAPIVDAASELKLGAFSTPPETSFYVPFDGFVGEAAYFTKALDGTERQDLTDYLHDKWIA